MHGAILSPSWRGAYSSTGTTLPFTILYRSETWFDILRKGHRLKALVNIIHRKIFELLKKKNRKMEKLHNRYLRNLKLSSNIVI
jgi:hypothetical protein